MQSEVASRYPSTYRYSTLRYVSDWKRDLSVPVGVAIWSPDTGAFYIRLPHTGESVEDVLLKEAAPHVASAESQLREWIGAGRLPYADREMPTLSDAWWEHVRKLLQFRVRLDDPKPIDCTDPKLDVEALFEAAVQPRQPAGARRARLDSAINSALGRDLARQFRDRETVEGFGRRPVRVQKCIERESQWVVVEAVNLATQHAEPDADALASRVLRIKEGPHGQRVRFVIGYLASPNGLNGEAVLKEWIEEKSESHLYDLSRESADFSRLAAVRIREIDPQADLFRVPG